MKWLIPILTVASIAYFGCSQAVRNPAGSENGKCYGNSTCNGDLVCSSANLCVRSENGGEGGSGGSESSGGESGNDQGGNDGSGGVSETGGNQDTGGSDGSGGEGSGGSGGDGSGGSEDTGGSPSGGSSGTGGSTTPGTNTCNATAGSNEVVFCKGQAVGAMTGWGWVALGSANTITDPTCDTDKAPITSSAACPANTNWNKEDALCMTGSIPELGEEPDYEGNWGVQVGVNAKDPNAGIGTTWKSVTISVTGSPSSGLRAVLHKSGDPDSVGYCASMTSGTAIPITDFNSKCWDSSGDPLTEGDSTDIDKISVQVSSTATAITVDNLCITKIELGN